MFIKRAFVVLLVAMLLITPVLVNASDSASSAIVAADRDARANTSGGLWFAAGFVLNIFGVGAAYIIAPSPKASSLLGKSPEYVAAYTDEYKSVATSIQTKNAWIGCLVGTAVGAVVYTVYYFVILAALEANTY